MHIETQASLPTPGPVRESTADDPRAPPGFPKIVNEVLPPELLLHVFEEVLKRSEPDARDHLGYQDVLLLV